jgi:hypothetical protein
VAHGHFKFLVARGHLKILCGTRSFTNSLRHIVIQNTTPLILPPSTLRAIIDCPGHPILQTLSFSLSELTDRGNLPCCF